MKSKDFLASLPSHAMESPPGFGGPIDIQWTMDQITKANVHSVAFALLLGGSAAKVGTASFGLLYIQRFHDILPDDLHRFFLDEDLWLSRFLVGYVSLYRVSDIFAAIVLVGTPKGHQSYPMLKQDSTTKSTTRTATIATTIGIISVIGIIASASSTIVVFSNMVDVAFMRIPRLIVSRIQYSLMGRFVGLQSTRFRSALSCTNATVTLAYSLDFRQCICDPCRGGAAVERFLVVGVGLFERLLLARRLDI
jgi:hypothetical protein